MPSARSLIVYLDGQLVGEVEQSAQGALRFTYDSDYLTSGPSPTPLSLSMPVAKRGYHSGKAVRAYLEGLLPDSEPTRQRWATQYGVSARNPFALLTHVGRDAAGAVQILPANVASTDAATRQGHIQWLSDDDFVSMARELAEHGADWNPGRYGGRWSLAGAQPKMALHRDPDTRRWGLPEDSTPTTHIIKPAIEGFEHHHINETLCLRAAAAAGLDTAQIELIEIDDVQAIISTRYDRRRSEGRWVRIHQEDLCQALSVHPSLKYQNDGGPGVGEIGDLFARLPMEDRRVSAERFFKGLAFNVLIGGTDAHAKNYSMFLIGNRAQVAPLYDIASAACYPQHSRLDSAMKVGERWKMLDVRDEDWAKAGRRLGLGSDQALEWVESLRTNLPDAFDDAVASLPSDVREEADRMAERIVEHVQRRWRPDEARNPRRVLPPARGESATSQTTHAPGGAVRGKTTPASNRTSFKARERTDPGVSLMPDTDPGNGAD